MLDAIPNIIDDLLNIDDAIPLATRITDRVLHRRHRSQGGGDVDPALTKYHVCAEALTDLRPSSPEVFVAHRRALRLWESRTLTTIEAHQ